MTIKQFGTGPLSILEIATEFGGDVGRPHGLNEFYAGGGRVPAGTVGYPNGPSGGAVAIPSTPPGPGNPISIRNFYGASNIVFNLSDKSLSLVEYFEGVNPFPQAFAQINYLSTGVLNWVVGNNSSYFPPIDETDHWIDSVPNGGDRSSVTSLYDFEWQFVTGDTRNQTQNLPNGTTLEWYHSISPAFNTRVNLGSFEPSISRYVAIYGGYSGQGASVDSYIQLRSLIYTAGTNTLRSSTLHTISLVAVASNPL